MSTRQLYWILFFLNPALLALAMMQYAAFRDSHRWYLVVSGIVNIGVFAFNARVTLPRIRRVLNHKESNHG